MKLHIDITLACFAVLSPCSNLMAQRVFEKGTAVIYEDAQRKQTSLGTGFSPVLTASGKVAIIRGRPHLPYGESFDCAQSSKKNWVAIYDPVTRSERTIFDTALPFEREGIRFCIFDQMQISLNGDVLYLVAPVFATSGSLAIVSLAQGTVKYVSGVNEIYVIESGSHRGELICSRRLYRVDGGSPYDAFVHAGADGEQIKVISEEYLAVSGLKAPLLAEYLRSIGGQITVDGHSFPEK